MCKIVFANKYLQVESIPYNGEDYFGLKLPDGAAVLAITDEREVILIKQFRPIVNQYTLEVPAGELDKGEDPLAAAERELYEETGYRCNKLYFLGSGTQLACRSTAKGFYYYGVGAKRDPNFVPKEDIEVVLIPKEHFREVVLSGELNHMLGLSLVLLANWKYGVEL